MGTRYGKKTLASAYFNDKDLVYLQALTKLNADGEISDSLVNAVRLAVVGAFYPVRLEIIRRHRELKIAKTLANANIVNSLEKVQIGDVAKLEIVEADYGELPEDDVLAIGESGLCWELINKDYAIVADINHLFSDDKHVMESIDLEWRHFLQTIHNIGIS